MKRVACSVAPYGGWPNCLHLTDGRTELVVTTDVGPRIIRYGLVKGQNLFKEFDQQMGRRGGTSWRIYGGHRLWIAPENTERTYIPDNVSVPWTWRNATLTVSKPADPLTGLTRTMSISFAPEGQVRVVHRITNDGHQPATLAPWALSVIAPGGEAVFPMEPFIPHPKALLPARPLVLWSYTNMADPRWTWGEREIRLRQDPAATQPQKIGFLNRQGWMAYLLNREVFIKWHPFQTGATYPDMGCNVETFTNGDMLELESLGPLVTLKPGSRTEHTETWALFRAAKPPTLRQLERWSRSMPTP